MDQKELKNVLDLHRKWVLGESGGMRADLRYADLRYADLRYANLRSADLRYADLRYADLAEIKKDFFKRLSLAEIESIGFYDAIKRGKVNGSAYEGECACFVGTIANLKKENYKSLSCGLKPEADSLTEKWFLAFEIGMNPDWHPVAKITSEWLAEFIKEHGLVVPEYRLISSLTHPKNIAKIISKEAKK